MSNGLLELTSSASQHIQRLMDRDKKPGAGLRVSVVGGGCSGMSYKMAFEEKPIEGDTVLELEGIQVFVDPKSALFFNGIVIDYVDDLNGSGFVYKNPNAKRSCGCGTSFSA